MIYWIPGTVLVVIILLVAVAMRSGKQRNQEVNEWAATIPVSEKQQEAMSKLWDTSQLHKPPIDDPLEQLSSEDRKYILRVCSADFRPARFGDANLLRTATFLKLTEEDGFNQEQAAVIVGMIFNGVGRTGSRLQRSRGILEAPYSIQDRDK